jgi:hypothetical protein
MRPDAEGCQAQRLPDRPMQVYKLSVSIGGKSMRVPWVRGLAALAALTILAADAAPPTAAAPSRSGSIWISIKNVYESNLNFGPLGKGHRDGTDRAEGTLTRQGSTYVGTVNAVVESNQQVSGLGQNCGPARFEDSQKLKVTGRPVGGFNDDVQSVTYAGAASGSAPPGNAGNEFLILEFVPETMPTQQPDIRLPQDMHPELVIACHTLIDTASGIAFLPLNDSRWTMEGGGYIIQLPASGVLDYTDTAVAEGHPQTIGPFEVKKSVWTIQIKRLP